MPNLNTYNINWDKLVTLLTPTKLRNNELLGWVRALIRPAQTLHNLKQTFRTAQRYLANHTFQIVYLEKALNEYYSISGYSPTNHEATKKIYIAPGEQLTQEYIFPRADNKPVYLSPNVANDPVYIYSRAEHESAYCRFVVMVPDTTTYIESELRALINQYISTRKFKIKTYTI